MNKQTTLRRTLLALTIAALGMSGSATAQTAAPDVSGDINKPQMLDVGPLGAVSFTSSITNASTTSPDVDYFGFEVSAEWLGKLVSVDIDEAHNGTAQSLDSTLHLFDPDGIMVLRSFITDPADAGSTVVPGSTSTRDPSLQYEVNKTGVWKIAVTAAPAMLADGGNFVPFMNRAFSNGSYKLIVTGLQPSMLQVKIDIKPGSKEIGYINPKSKGMIPVMLLSDKEKGFDPFEIEEVSLKFGRKGDEDSFGRCLKHGTDHNGDGMPDRLCHFDNERTGFRPGDSMGIVRGTFKNKAFEGRGDLKVHEKAQD